MNNKSIKTSKSNIFDLTFTINSLPTHLIRKILSYYYNHCLTMYKHIQKTVKVTSRYGGYNSYDQQKNTAGYKIKFRWMDLCLVCKFWMEMVMPFLPNTFYWMDSQQKLETYLNLVEYGGTFPRRYLKATVLRVVKPPASIKRYPFHINSLGIYINRYQQPSQYQPDTIIPEFIYQQILQHSPDLKTLYFSTVQQREQDLFYLIKSIIQLQSSVPLLTTLNFDRCQFNANQFNQLCKLIELDNCSIVNLILNNCTLNVGSGSSNDAGECSFLGSLKKNKSICKLKMDSNDFFSNHGSTSNKKLIIGGTVLEFFKFIFTESTKISHFDFLENEIYLSNQITQEKIKIDYLVPMQTNLKKFSLSLVNIDGFLPFLEYSINSCSNYLEEINISNSSFSDYQSVNNFLNSIQHCQSLTNLNISSSNFNFTNQQHHQPQQIQNHFQNDDDDENQDFDNDDNHLNDVNTTNAFDNNNFTTNGPPETFEKLSFLYGTQSLVSINLSSISIDGEGEIIKLLNQLCQSPQIKQLYLNRCGLTGSCLTALTNFIRQPSSKLELLHVAKNSLLGQSIEILLMAFQLNKSLTDVDLSFNQMTDIEGHHIANFIKQTNQIRHLNISGSRFKLGAINQIGHSLMVNKSLVSLNLSNVEMGMLEVTYIFDGLVSHPSISLLNLSNVGSKEMIFSLIETSGLRCNIIY